MCTKVPDVAARRRAAAPGPAREPAVSARPEFRVVQGSLPAIPGASLCVCVRVGGCVRACVRQQCVTWLRGRKHSRAGHGHTEHWATHCPRLSADIGQPPVRVTVTSDSLSRVPISLILPPPCRAPACLGRANLPDSRRRRFTPSRAPSPAGRSAVCALTGFLCRVRVMT